MDGIRVDVRVLGQVGADVMATRSTDMLIGQSSRLLLQFALIIQQIINLYKGVHQITCAGDNISFVSNDSINSSTTDWLEVLAQPSSENMSQMQDYRWILSVQNFLLQRDCCWMNCFLAS